jgi:membrane-associated phospholipid phosphatase
MKRAIRTVLICFAFASAAWAQQVQVSANYLYQGSNRVPGATDWFGANGGRADTSFGNWRHLGLVAEFAGATTSNLTTFTYLAGPRRSIGLGRVEKHKVSAFAQVLLGGVHASDGLFPSGTTNKNSADAFALSTGGGLEVGLNHGISLRLIQADYLYTRLPNLYDNYESNFRLGAGVAFRPR